MPRYSSHRRAGAGLPGRSALAVLALLWGAPGHAVTDVNPNGVNVRSTGNSTIFLTFQNVGADETSGAAFWCGELTAAGTASRVTTTNPCAPGTVFGQLPSGLDLSRRSGTGGVSNLTDIMTIPRSVVRRSFQDAASGGNGTFFYVRRFDSPTTGTTFVRVTCRMAGGGARVPLALTRVEVNFLAGEGHRAVVELSADELAPPIAAEIEYNGSGRLKGRWEIVRPSDPAPTEEDLLTEASLPVEQRARQRRWPVLDRFDINLPPTGRAVIPGPPARSLPLEQAGMHLVILRIEATADKEGDSNTLTGTVNSGGVAGFPMPVLRYTVRRVSGASSGLDLIAPADHAGLPGDRPVAFQWGGHPDAAYYLLIVDADGLPGFRAVVRVPQTRYVTPPSGFFDNVGTRFRWRMTAIGKHGETLAVSAWRSVVLEP